MKEKTMKFEQSSTPAQREEFRKEKLRNKAARRARWHAERNAPGKPGIKNQHGQWRRMPTGIYAARAGIPF